MQNFPKLADCHSTFAKIGALAAAKEANAWRSLFAAATGIKSLADAGRTLDALAVPTKARIAAIVVAASRKDPAMTRADLLKGTDSDVDSLCPGLDKAAKAAQVRRGIALAAWFMHGDALAEPSQAELDILGASKTLPNLGAKAWAEAQAALAARPAKPAKEDKRAPRTPVAKGAETVTGAPQEAEEDSFARAWSEGWKEAETVVLAALADMQRACENATLSRAQLAATIGKAGAALAEALAKPEA